MTTAQIIRTAAEIIAVVLVVYGVLNERRIIDLEDRVLSKFKEFIKNFNKRGKIQ